MNIVLTGLRGSGKSEIGKLIAEKLGLDFIDLDQEIEAKENMTISKIVELRGWKYFRKKEKEAVKKIANRNNCVISTGGGTIMDRDNEKLLKKNGKIVYLHRASATCAKYILNKSNRPPLTKAKTVAEEMKQLYKERNGKYCKSAFLVFERTDDLEADTKKIIKSLTGS